jgi:hypothetical protein
VARNAKRDLKFVFVEHMDEVLDVALCPAPKEAKKAGRAAKARGRRTAKPKASARAGRKVGGVSPAAH